MSELKKLLKDVKVEWKYLQEVAELKRGRVMSKNYLLDNQGSYPVYSSQTVNNGEIGKIDSFDFFGEYITWTTDGANAGTVFYRKGNFSITNVCGLININNDVSLNYKFLYYWLSIEAKEHVYSGMGNPKLMSHQMGKIQIPILCPDNPEQSLKIQSEIVRILDKLTEQTNALIYALEQELKAHQKQYEHYREELFRFKEVEASFKYLDSIGAFQRGKRFVKTDMIEAGIPCIHYGEMYTYYGIWVRKSKSYLSKELVESKNLRKAIKGDVVIVGAGETIEDIGKGTAWLGDESVVIHDACFLFRSDLNPVYLAYYTRTKQFHNQIKKKISSGKISAINTRGLEKVLVPVITPIKQQRIVTILDQLDEATQAIKLEIKKEIELRNKQYEYYRDLLVTFPKDN